MFTTALAAIVLASLLGTVQAAPQSMVARERARPLYDEGQALLRSEQFDAAAKAFRQATEIDPSYEMAFYMLGRVHLAQRNYASATYALTRSRDLYRAQGSQSFADKQEGQRLRRERLAEIDHMIGELQRALTQPANQNQQFYIQEQIRQYEERKRQLQDLDRSHDLSPERLVPAYVSLSLGSAYFRTSKLADAEAAYLAAVAADPKVGEAHNNLAVIYMETGRLAEAEKAVKAAEKTGLRVSPALKDEIKKRKKSGS